MRGDGALSLGEAGATTTPRLCAGATSGGPVRARGDRTTGAGRAAWTGCETCAGSTGRVTTPAGAGGVEFATGAGATAGSTSPGAGPAAVGSAGAVCAGGTTGSAG